MKCHLPHIQDPSDRHRKWLGSFLVRSIHYSILLHQVEGHYTKIYCSPSYSPTRCNEAMCIPSNDIKICRSTSKLTCYILSVLMKLKIERCMHSIHENELSSLYLILSHAIGTSTIIAAPPVRGANASISILDGDTG